MSTISVREFSDDPSAVFARVEKGEAFQMTRRGAVIAVLLPGSGPGARYSDLAAQGRIRLKTATTSDLDRLPRYDFPADAPDPVELLLAEREDESRRSPWMRRPSALTIGEALDCLVTYDKRMLDAARESGLDAFAPGATT